MKLNQFVKKVVLNKLEIYLNVVIIFIDILMILIDWFTHIRYVSITFMTKTFLAVILTLSWQLSHLHSKQRDPEAVL